MTFKRDEMYINVQSGQQIDTPCLAACWTTDVFLYEIYLVMLNSFFSWLGYLGCSDSPAFIGRLKNRLLQMGPRQTSDKYEDVCVIFHYCTVYIDFWFTTADFETSQTTIENLLTDSFETCRNMSKRAPISNKLDVG